MNRNQENKNLNQTKPKKANRANTKFVIMVAFFLIALFAGILANVESNAANLEVNPLSDEAADLFAMTANASLTVRAVNLRNTKGKVYFYIYNTQESWKASEKDGKSLRTLSAAVKAGSTAKNNEATVIFEDLPVGTYAVQIHHDENDNGKMDSTLGIPKEGYGMSNNPKIGMSIPKWDDCKFDVVEGEQTIEIKGKY